MYTREMKADRNIEYIKMLKMDIDYRLFGRAREIALDFMD